jgi:hypothetical protein
MPCAYSLFAPLSRDVGSENAREMAVMRNDIAQTQGYFEIERKRPLFEKSGAKTF